MKNKKQLLTALAVLLILGCISTSCTDEGEFEESINDARLKSSIPIGQEIILGQQYPNPYKLQNMLETKDSVERTGLVDDCIDVYAKDLYVRFLPQDSMQLNKLIEEDSLTLFDHPLDYEILQQGDYYHDPNIHADDITWQYTTVSMDYVFDNNIPYEILDTCFIPDETRESNNPTPLDILEVAAYHHVGLDNVFDFESDNGEVLTKTSKQTNTKSILPKGKKPSGYIKVYNDVNNNYIGVKGVKILVNTLVKWHTTHTDDSGSYKINHKYYCNPFYTVTFSNEKKFDIWSNYIPMASIYVQGVHNKSGYSWNISKNSSAWNLATVNNGAYDYFNWCISNGISLPPTRTKILTVGWMSKGCDGMFRRLTGYVANHGYSKDVFKDLLLFYGLPVANYLVQLLKFGLPDIVIGTQDHNYATLWRMTNHELAHASHFSTVGSPYWCKDMSYILSCWGAGQDTYGDGTLPYAEYCAVTEMWAYAIGNIRGISQFPNHFKESGLTNGNCWFNPVILINIIRQEKILTEKQVYECLTPNVTNRNALKQALKQKTSNQAHKDRIDELFEINDLILN